MSHKRRLTGYMEEADDVAKSREKGRGRRKEREERRHDVEAPPEITSDSEEPSVVVASSFVGVGDRKQQPILKKDKKKKNQDSSDLSANESAPLDRGRAVDHVTFHTKTCCSTNEISKKQICQEANKLCLGVTIPRGLPLGRGRYIVPIPKGRNTGNAAQDMILQQTYSYSSLQCDMDKVCPGTAHPSVAPRMTTYLERKLFALCKCGNVCEVQSFLACHPKLNVNSRSYEGESALRIAVQYGHEALVAFLTSLSCICMGDVILYAIWCRQTSIVKYLCEKFNLDKKVCTLKENDFPKYVTPLSLAAEVGSYEIIDYLINCRCHELIMEPHNVRCRCRLICHPMKKGDQLEVAYRTLHIYRALSNPYYYIHTTDDPFAKSFRLYHRLMDIAEFFLPLKARFVCLAERAQQFAVDLIAECRNSDEVKSILTHPTGIVRWWDNLSKTVPLPTLYLALDYKQKCFISQPPVQVVVKEMWMGDFYAWKMMKPFVKVIQAFVRYGMSPLVYFSVVTRPKSSSTTSLVLPVNKFLSSAGSYVVFLCLLFYMNLKPRPRFRCPFTSTDIEIYITIWVFAMTVNAARQAIAMHPRRYFNFKWNWYDMTTLLVFWTGIAFWISAQIHYHMLDVDVQRLERKYWSGLDPILMSDGFFVMGSILAYLRLFFYLQIGRHMGPMQIAVDAMLKEFVKYSVFWLVIMAGFTVALAKFYSYYRGMKYVDPDSGISLKQEDGFTSLRSTFKTLFFGMFGMSAVSNADVVIENIKTCRGTYLNEHNFTEFIGYAAFGVYMILMVFVVINMVIATMVSAYGKVLISVDTESKFNETYIYLYFMAHAVLSAPFNLLPHVYGLSSKGVFKKKARHECLPPPSPPPPYCELIKRLVLRYSHSNSERKKIKKVCYDPKDHSIKRCGEGDKSC